MGEHRPLLMIKSNQSDIKSINTPSHPRTESLGLFPSLPGLTIVQGQDSAGWKQARGFPPRR